MNDDDEVIETSDADERDAIHADEYGYWQQAVSDIQSRRSTLPHHSHHGPPPRKRVKLDHYSSVLYRVTDGRLLFPSPTNSIHIEDDFKSPSVFPSACPSSPSDDLSGHSAKSSFLISTSQHIQDNNDDPQDFTLGSFDNSQDPLNMFMTQGRGADEFTQDKSTGTAADGTVVNPYVQPNPPNSRSESRSRSRSIDPLYLFNSSPQNSTGTPNTRCSESPILVPTTSPITDLEPVTSLLTPQQGDNDIDHNDTLPSNSQPQQSQNNSSPRYSYLIPPPPGQKPTSSSPMHRQSSPLSLTPSPPPSPDRNTNNPEAQDEALSHNLQLNDSDRRYSMRQRRPQQLHPYIHDQILYKRQMRSNPDAIVKFGIRVGSPRKRSRSRGGDGEEMQERGAGARWVETQTQDWRTDVDEMDVGEDTWFDRRRNKNLVHTDQSDSAGPHAGSSDAHVHANLNPIPAWLPENLQDLPSSDDDVQDVKDLLQEGRRVKQRAKQREREATKERQREEIERKRRRRMRPFPMRKKHERERGREKGDGDSGGCGSPVSHLRILPQPNMPLHSRNLTINPKASAISTHTTPRHSPSAFGDTARYDYSFSDGGEEVEDDSAWIGHADDGGMNFNFESPVRPHPQSPGFHSRRWVSKSPTSDPKMNQNPPNRSHHSNTDSTSSHSDSEPSSSDEMTSKDRKRLKALQRMMPAAMARQLQKKAQQQKAKASANVKRQRSATIDDGGGDSDVVEGPLMPGKTRVRIGQRKGDMQIKGDTESEDSDPPAHTARLHSEPSGLELVGPENPRKHDVASDHVTYISDSMGEEESNDDEVDDAKIDAWLGHRPRSTETGHPRRLREESLVDWMLTRTRTVGGQGKAENRKKRNNKSTRRPGGARGNASGRLRIITSGAQVEQQTLLSFEKQPKPKYSKGTWTGPHAHSTRWSPVENDVDVDDRDDDQELGVNNQWVEGKKYGKSAAAMKNRKQRRGPQVYVFASKGTRITSGRRRLDHGITIDVEDDVFHQALAPKSALRPPARRKVKPKPAGVRNYPDVAMMSMPQNIEVDYEPPARCPDMQTSFEHRRDIKVDFEIHFLPSGLAFQPNTYIGKGWLHELVTLVTGNDNIAVPNSYAAHGIELGPATSPSGLATTLVSVGDGLLNFVSAPADSHTAESISHWEVIIRTVCQLLSWLPSHFDGEECSLLGDALQEQLFRLVTNIDGRHGAFGDDGTPMNNMVLPVYWFAVESLVRFSCSFQKSQPELVFDTKNLIKYIALLARRLQNYGMQRVIEPILAGPEGLDTLFIPIRIAELWVCLFHLVSNCHVPTSDDSKLPQHHPFWRIIQLTLQRDDGSSHAGLEASETTWRTIFSICALSQFSVHGMSTSTCRLPASWELVAFALKQIRLVADPDTDRTLSERILDKRDEYIWLIASRCFILCNQWHWRIDDASVMFIQLASIFRSRKYANLRREASDFPSFMRTKDLQLLAQYKPSDTAFEIFLKLIVQALKDCYSDDQANAQRIMSSKLKKLLALAIPVGSVPFTKSTPPTTHELSMLYNRLSAVAVAIYLESSPTSVEKRLTHARRYVNFKDADDTTRVACIRGMMHFAIIMRYRRLPLDHVLSWLAEMTDVLVDEYRDTNAPGNKLNNSQPSNVSSGRVEFSIQMLLGSVRHIIETPNIDSAQPQQHYPEPALLNGPWVTRIFATFTNLTHVGTTGLEIRKLVQAFLDARQAAMPVPQRHLVIDPGENQESQEEYGAFDLDLDDPELQAALGDNVESSIAKQNKDKDEQVWQVIDSHITPAIFRLVCKHFNDPSNAASFEEYCHDADKWVNCWVGCANVLVQLGKRKWETFLELGPMSWEKIIDASWRRRVGLRFMFMLLRCDPEAYTSRNDLFVKILLESIVAAKVTMEHEYMSLVFSIDRLRHPLLRHIPCQRPLETADYVISVPQFFTMRLPAVDVIFTNLADSLHKEAQGKDNGRQNQTYIGHIVAMLSTMQDVCEQMTDVSDGRTTYSAFCRDVFSSLRQHPELVTQQRLAASVAWGQTLEGI